MSDASEDGPIPEAASPADLTRAMFEDRIGEAFSMRGGDHVCVQLVLEEVSATRHGGDRPGGGFCLGFSGPEAPYFMQGNIILTLPDGRETVLFAVNTGPKEGRMQYQIILS